jgi:hypothetical protein
VTLDVNVKTLNSFSGLLSAQNVPSAKQIRTYMISPQCKTAVSRLLRFGEDISQQPVLDTAALEALHEAYRESDSDVGSDNNEAVALEVP